MTRTPHFLLFNSDIGFKAANIKGVTCINAGSYTKGNTIGSILKITVLDDEMDKIIVDEI